MYLNDVSEGGATRFDKLSPPLDVTPRKEDAPVLSGDEGVDADARTLHTLSGARSREVDIAAVGVRSRGSTRRRETAGSRGQGRATRRGEGGEEGGQKGAAAAGEDELDE